jgi:predicted DNA-binding transcriptional regulator AlpA
MPIDLANEPLVSVKEAADHFGISRAATWRLILSDKWPSVKIGGSRRTSIQACARAIEASNKEELAAG